MDSKISAWVEKNGKRLLLRDKLNMTQTQSLHEFLSQPQCALSIATFIGKVLEHRGSLLTFTCIMWNVFFCLICYIWPPKPIIESLSLSLSHTHTHTHTQYTLSRTPTGVSYIHEHTCTHANVRTCTQLTKHAIRYTILLQIRDNHQIQAIITCIESVFTSDPMWIKSRSSIKGSMNECQVMIMLEPFIINAIFPSLRPQ